MSSWNRSQNRSLISVACGDGVTNSVPVSVSASVTFSTTCGLRWPTSIAPNPIDRSSSRLPSTSVSHAPRAEAIEIGYGLPVLERAGDPERQRLARPLVVRTRLTGPRGEPRPLGGQQPLDDLGVDRAGARRAGGGRCRGRARARRVRSAAGRSFGAPPPPPSGGDTVSGVRISLGFTLPAFGFRCQGPI